MEVGVRGNDRGIAIVRVFRFATVPAAAIQLIVEYEYVKCPKATKAVPFSICADTDAEP